MSKVIEVLNELSLHAKNTKTPIDINTPIIKDLERAGYLSPNFIQNMNLILPEIIGIFPENQWSISFGYVTPSLGKTYKMVKKERLFTIFFSIDIHFPKITIKNSKHKHIDITDLYVKVKFLPQGNIEIQGARGSLTRTELSSSYFHSHLSTSTPIGKFSRFCLGTGDIDTQKLELIMALGSYRNFLQGKTSAFSNHQDAKREIKIRITHLLLQLEPYVSWESLEGGPHNTMDEVFIRQGNIEDLNMIDVIVAYNKLIHHLINDDNLNIPIRVQNNEYVIIDNDVLEKSITQAYLKYGPSRTESYHYLVYKDKSGNYFPQSIENNDNLTIPEEYIYFNGEQRKVEFVPEPKIDRNNLFIHPKIRNYVINKLKFAIHNAGVEQSIINRLQNTSNHTQGSTRQNQVLV